MIVPRLENGTGIPRSSDIVGTKSVCDTVLYVSWDKLHKK